MNTKHKKITCSLGEFAERYINGEQFYQMDSGHACEIPAYNDISLSELINYYEQGVYELVEPVWYENLGGGVLCWVWDNDQTPKVICLVTDYNCVKANPYKTYMDDFINAKPLTKEEAMRFVWGEM